MNLKNIRNLQEAYLDVYQEVDEATAMSKRGLDEPAIRNKTAAKTSASGAGQSADRATKLADKPTYGDNKKKEGRENLARKQRGTFRDTTSSSPGLRGYGFKSNDPAVKAKQDARGNQRARAALTPNERKQLNMEFDPYDIILSHLIDEGYADTEDSALVIMANMSEDWRDSICEGMKPLPLPVEKMDAKAKELKSKFRKSKVGTPESSKLLSRLSHIVATRDSKVV